MIDIEQLRVELERQKREYSITLGVLFLLMFAVGVASGVGLMLVLR